MPLEKACIKVLESCVAGGVNFNKDEKLFVQFNPEKYSINANVQYSFAAKEGKLYGQYSGENPRTLSVELFFDMLSASSVYQKQALSDAAGISNEIEGLMNSAGAVSAAYVNKIMALTKPGKEKGAPPMAEFMWGGESLKGVVSSASLNYVLFNIKGEPTRATLQLTFNECHDVLKVDKNEQLKLAVSGSAGAGGLPGLGKTAGELEVKEAIIKMIKLL